MEHDPPEPRPREPVSPKNIAAEMVTAIVLLSGTWGVEWVKGRFDRGVPTLAMASLTLGELTVLLYFVRSTIRATVWAVNELREAISSTGLDNVFGRLSRTAGNLMILLWAAVPSVKQLKSALRLLVLVLAVA